MNKLKREIPKNEIIEWREHFLKNLKKTIPKKQENYPVGLENGNSKLGQFGKFFESVYVWNLPSVSTCPGASKWCLKNCYNADQRIEKFPLEKWQTNWWHVENNKEELKFIIEAQLEQTKTPCAVRLHSSGDFFSIEYIKFWYNIVRMNSKISFWAYTRSWIIDELLLPLTDLQQLENIQLFASWDNTMIKTPPRYWRKSLVVDNLDEIRNFNTLKNVVCPEQFGEKPNCASCGFCISASDKNIIFTLH